MQHVVMYYDLCNKTQRYNWPDIADIGRQMEAYIIINDIKQEINVWHEKEYCEYLLTNENK